MKQRKAILALSLVIAVIILMIPITSCKKRESDKIAYDHIESEKLNQILIDTSKVFKINETKEVVFEIAHNTNRCILIEGGSSFISSDVIYKEYLEKQIPEKVAKQLIREPINEGINLYFLRDDEILYSVKSGYANTKDGIYYSEIDEKITFSIQLPQAFKDRIINDPNFLKHPDIGQDYLTNPNRPKPIEIVGIK